MTRLLVDLPYDHSMRSRFKTLAAALRIASSGELIVVSGSGILIRKFMGINRVNHPQLAVLEVPCSSLDVFQMMRAFEKVDGG